MTYDATVLFIHPFHNIAVIRYDPRDLVRKLLVGGGEAGGAAAGEEAWAAAAEEAWRMVEAVAVSAKPMVKGDRARFVGLTTEADPVASEVRFL